MNANHTPDQFLSLWQSQPTESFVLSPNQIRAMLNRLEKHLRRRDTLIYGICLAETVWFASCLVRLSGWFFRTGSALLILAMGFLSVQIWLDGHRRRAARTRAEESGSVSSLQYYRSELLRQRNFHCGLWFWSRLLVVLPGLLVFGIGGVYVYPHSPIGYVLTAATLILFSWAVQLNRRKSKSYQRQIDALDALSREPA